MTYAIYQLLTILLSPFINMFLWYRWLTGKEDRKRFKERFGKPTIKRPEGDIIWVACASVGESIASLSLIDKIIEKSGNKITVLITTTTMTSAKMLEKRLAGKTNILHQYTPIDKYMVVLNFLKFWKPIALITVESEIWPNTMILAHKYCKKVMVASAKMSDRSFVKWQKYDMLRKKVFGAIDVFYPQSKGDDSKLQALGVNKTIMIGNLKFDSKKNSVNQEYLAFLKEGIGDRPFILCASTHVEENERLFELYEKMHAKNKDLLFVLATRHPNKSDENFQAFSKNGFVVKRKSQKEQIDKDTNFYMYDEMGEMGTFYELSKIVLLCGSLVDDIGGHNPIEVALFGCAIISAPFIANNKVLFDALVENDACIVNADKNNVVGELQSGLERLLASPQEVEKLEKNSKSITEKFSHIAGEMAESVLGYLA